MTKYKLKKGRFLGLLIIILLIIGFIYRGPIVDFTKNTFDKTKDLFNKSNKETKSDTTSNNDIAASVDGEVITQLDVDSKYDKLPPQYKSVMTKEDLLEQMITEKVILNQAKDVVISESEVDDTISEVLKLRQITEEQLKESLTEQGITLEELREGYRNQMKINKFLKDNLFSELSVSDNEIKNYYNKNIELFKGKEGQVRALHILVKSEAEAKDVVNELKSKIFSSVAKSTSIGPSSVNGGDLGFVNKGELVSEFETVLFELDEDEVSAPVKTQFGWHVIKRATDIVSLEDSSKSIEDSLLAEKQNSVLETYVKQLKSNAKIVYGSDANLEEVIEQQPTEAIDEDKVEVTKEEIAEDRKDTVETDTEEKEVVVAKNTETKTTTDASLGECLKDSVLYTIGSKFCKEQKEELGNDFESIVVVDCTKVKCADIKGFPAWKINDEVQLGFKTKTELRDLASC